MTSCSLHVTVVVCRWFPKDHYEEMLASVSGVEVCKAAHCLAVMWLPVSGPSVIMLLTNVSCLIAGILGR